MIVLPGHNVGARGSGRKGPAPLIDKIGAVKIQLDHFFVQRPPPDAEGFRRSRGQIAAELNRAMARGRRNL